MVVVMVFFFFFVSSRTIIHSSCNTTTQPFEFGGEKTPDDKKTGEKGAYLWPQMGTDDTFE